MIERGGSGPHGMNRVRSGARIPASSTAAIAADTLPVRLPPDPRSSASVDGKWQEPAVDFASVLPADMKEFLRAAAAAGPTPPGECGWRFAIARAAGLAHDGWAAQGRWDVFVTAYLGDRWLHPSQLPQSGGRNDMRISSQRDRDGNVYFAYASDNRPWQPTGMPPRNHHVAVSRFATAPRPARRSSAGPRTDLRRCPDRFIRERRNKWPGCATTRSSPVARPTASTAATCTGIRTSRDGPGDGSLMDLHRYALDAAAFDFILVGDHNMGQDNEYCWWRTQHANDLYTVPGRFISHVWLRAQRQVSRTAIATSSGRSAASHVAGAGQAVAEDAQG